MKGFVEDIEVLTVENGAFRRVLYTSWRLRNCPCGTLLRMQPKPWGMAWA